MDWFQLLLESVNLLLRFFQVSFLLPLSWFPVSFLSQHCLDLPHHYLHSHHLHDLYLFLCLSLYLYPFQEMVSSLTDFLLHHHRHLPCLACCLKLLFTSFKARSFFLPILCLFSSSLMPASVLFDHLSFIYRSWMHLILSFVGLLRLWSMSRFCFPLFPSGRRIFYYRFI